MHARRAGDFMRPIAGTIVALLALAGAPAFAQMPSPEAMAKPTEPFKIIGNVYYVGTEGSASYLINSPQGSVLIDAGPAETVMLVEASIEKLGFQLADIKYLLSSRAAPDRAGGLAKFKKDTGAQIVASAADKPLLEGGLANQGVEAVHVDRVVGDNDKLNLVDARVTRGGVLFVARLTPGPTPGCTSWTLPVREQKWNHTVIFECGAFVGDNRLVGASARPGIVEDYQKTFESARGIIADVFVAPYPPMFKMNDKRALIHDGWLNPFIKAGEYHAYLDAAEKEFKAELARQQQALSADATATPAAAGKK
jgi:metallo-beta-lactamase class B